MADNFSGAAGTLLSGWTSTQDSSTYSKIASYGSGDLTFDGNNGCYPASSASALLMISTAVSNTSAFVQATLEYLSDCKGQMVMALDCTSSSFGKQLVFNLLNQQLSFANVVGPAVAHFGGESAQSPATSNVIRFSRREVGSAMVLSAYCNSRLVLRQSIANATFTTGSVYAAIGSTGNQIITANGYGASTGMHYQALSYGAATPSISVQYGQVAQAYPFLGQDCELILYGMDTDWTSGTTFAVTGGAGATIAVNSINVATQTANCTLYTGTGSSNQTLQVTDSTNGATATFAVSVPVGSTLTSPILSVISKTTGGVQVGASDPGNGVAPRSYKWYRSLAADLSGGTLLATTSINSYFDPTGTPGQLYFYWCVVNDSSSTPQAATSVAAGANTTTPMSTGYQSVPAFRKVAKVGVANFGTSITGGTGATGGATTLSQMMQAKLRNADPTSDYVCYNFGFPGSTTTDWINTNLATQTALFQQFAAADGCTELIACNEFAANDAVTGDVILTRSQFSTNINSITSTEIGAGITPAWFGALYREIGTGNANAAAVELLREFDECIKSIVNNTTVLGAGLHLFEHFERFSAAETTDGAHPNDTGQGFITDQGTAGLLASRALSAMAAGYSDPGAAHVQAGTTYLYNGTTETGTYSGTSGTPSVSDSSVQADVTAALVALGYTGARAARLDNLDAAVSTRSTLAGPAGFNSLQIANGKVAIDTTQLLTTRDQTSNAAPTIMDALAAAHASATGKETKPATAGTTTGVLYAWDESVFRTFTYDSGTAPTQRS